jgi:hypothetical protein
MFTQTPSQTDALWRERGNRMKNRSRTIRRTCVVTAISVVLMGASIAAARDYTRSCNATIRVTNARRNMTTIDYGRFSASYTMSTYRPNTIRVHAHNRAVACVRAGWENRYRDTPAECTSSHGVSGYPSGLIAYHIGREVSEAWGCEPGSSVHVNVYANVWGDKGCGGSRRSKSSPWVVIARDQELTCR